MKEVIDIKQEEERTGQMFEEDAEKLFLRRDDECVNPVAEEEVAGVTEEKANPLPLLRDGLLIGAPAGNVRFSRAQSAHDIVRRSGSTF